MMFIKCPNCKRWAFLWSLHESMEAEPMVSVVCFKCTFGRLSDTDKHKRHRGIFRRVIAASYGLVVEVIEEIMLADIEQSKAERAERAERAEKEESHKYE